MTLLRRRMLEELRIRNYAPRTVQTYINAVAAFAKYHGRSPDRLGPEEIREYQLHLLDERNAKSGTLVVVAAALRFFYRVVLQRDLDTRQIPFPRRERPLPVILSRGEIDRLLAAATSLRDRTILFTAYATGLRVSELVGLRVTDIDGERQLIRVHQGKGRKDRYVPLFPVLRQSLRNYYRQARPDEWLFPGAVQGTHLNRDTVLNICHRSRSRAGLRKKVTPHTLRRCFATHLLENGVDLLTIKMLLGHRSFRTVELYTLVSKYSRSPQPLGMDLLEGLDVAAPRQAMS